MAAARLPPLALAENPDILAGVARSPARPALLIGFAAETNDVIAHAEAKLAKKGATGSSPMTLPSTRWAAKAIGAYR